MIDATCQQCGGTFKAERPTAKWCSQRCCSAAANERARSRCRGCKAPLRGMQEKWCSDACRMRQYRRPPRKPAPTAEPATATGCTCPRPRPVHDRRDDVWTCDACGELLLDAAMEAIRAGALRALARRAAPQREAIAA